MIDAPQLWINGVIMSISLSSFLVFFGVGVALLAVFAGERAFQIRTSAEAWAKGTAYFDVQAKCAREMRLCAWVLGAFAVGLFVAAYFV